MQASYEVRSTQSPWLRVMRLYGQPSSRSVHSQKSGLFIEAEHKERSPINLNLQSSFDFFVRPRDRNVGSIPSCFAVACCHDTELKGRPRTTEVDTAFRCCFGLKKNG